MTEHYIPNGKGNIHSLHNDKPGDLLVLMVPGMFGVAEDCLEEFAHLKDHSIAAISLRGRGKSSSEFESYSFESHTSDVDAAIEYFKDKKIVLFAHSFGCLPSIAAAAMHPNQVVGLILVDKGLTQRQISQEWLDRIVKTPPPNASIEVARRVFEEMKPIDLNSTFSTLKISKLIFKGELQGSALSTDEAENLAQQPKTKVLRLLNSAHWPAAEDYPAFITEIENLLQTLSSKT
jgi:pimeloyl-ACP methyl ester carboxylesterase